MKLFNNSKNVQHFYLYQKGIVFLTGSIRDRSLIFMNDDIYEVLIKNSIIPSFKVFNNYIVAYSPQKSVIIGDNSHSLEYDNYIIKDIVIKNCFIADKIIEEEKRYLCLYDADNNDIKWMLNKMVHFLLIHKDIVLCEQSNTDIIAININTGIEFWQFSIEDFPSYQDSTREVINAEIKQIIGIYANILWVHIGKFHIVGIDVYTGQKMHHIENLPSFLGLEDQREFVLGATADYNFHLDKQQGILKAFANRYYVEIDLKQMKGSVKKDFGADFQTSWRIRQSTFYEGDDNLYFVGARKGEVVGRAV